MGVMGGCRRIEWGENKTGQREQNINFNQDTLVTDVKKRERNSLDKTAEGEDLYYPEALIPPLRKPERT